VRRGQGTRSCARLRNLDNRYLNTPPLYRFLHHLRQLLFEHDIGFDGIGVVLMFKSQFAFEISVARFESGNIPFLNLQF
jgi:hypothetical protein